MKIIFFLSSGVENSISIAVILTIGAILVGFRSGFAKGNYIFENSVEI